MKEYKVEEDPKKFLSTKTGRGKLTHDWKTTTKPMMCVYKLVTCEFKWFGLQNKAEKYIQNVFKSFLVTNYFKIKKFIYARLYC